MDVGVSKKSVYPNFLQSNREHRFSPPNFQVPYVWTKPHLYLLVRTLVSCRGSLQPVRRIYCREAALSRVHDMCLNCLGLPKQSNPQPTKSIKVKQYIYIILCYIILYHVILCYITLYAVTFYDIIYIYVCVNV